MCVARVFLLWFTVVCRFLGAPGRHVQPLFRHVFVANDVGKNDRYNESTPKKASLRCLTSGCYCLHSNTLVVDGVVECGIPHTPTERNVIAASPQQSINVVQVVTWKNNGSHVVLPWWARV